VGKAGSRDEEELRRRGKRARRHLRVGGKEGRRRPDADDGVTPFRVTFDLHFDKPFRADNTGEFILQSAGGATTVTWGMNGARPFFHKLMGVFINLDRLVGKDFEAGLASIKSIAER
jgi:hypothetical protein